jgi:hypothetical protein
MRSLILRTNSFEFDIKKNYGLGVAFETILKLFAFWFTVKIILNIHKLMRMRMLKMTHN